MEARSFADLNDLAFNPPQYPVKPGEEKREALTLYIMRVPGTRDVFLSPFKPAAKSVTAEDIAASLYYVHLRDPLSDYAQPKQPPIPTTTIPSQPKIARKALPPSARPITPESPPKTDAAAIHPENGANGSWDQEETAPPLPPRRPDGPPKLLTQQPTRKPVGPRPISLGPGHIPNTTLNISDPAPPRASFSSARTLINDEPISPVRSTSPPGQFTLQLIRRDRSSGNQWNIAQISCGPEQEPAIAPALSFGCPNNNKSANGAALRAPIEIGIQNSGYAKFRNMPSAHTLENGPAAIREALASRGGAHATNTSSQQSLPHDTTPSNQEAFPGATFSRQVTMEYAKSFSSAVKEKLAKLEQTMQERRAHCRGESTSSWGNLDLSPQAIVSENSKQSLKPRGYAFESPWNGRCEFRTMQGGRALRCVHTLTSGAANGGETQTFPVSEIRFNLPPHEHLPNPGHATNSQLISSQLEHFASTLPPSLRPRSQSTSSDWDDEEVERGERGDIGVNESTTTLGASNGSSNSLDLSLGREKAGGGRRGTRTKMGKLIVTGEGLKMLDLVVAANVGVWWETWERSF